MKKMMKEVNKNFLVMILFSWTFFVGAILLSIRNYVDLPIEQNILNVFSNGYWSTGQKYFHWLFMIGYFSPLFIYFWHLKKEEKKKLKFLQFKKVKEYICKKHFMELVKFEKVNKYLVLLVVTLPLITLGLAFVFDKILNFDYFVSQYSFVYFIPLFIFTFLTFSTAEFGFRKYFLDTLLKKKSFIESSLMVAVMSLIWVLPYIGYFHFVYGYPSMIFSLIFFSLFYVSLSVILSFLYYDTKNILFTWLSSAWLYSIYMFVLSMFYNSYTGVIMFAITFLIVATLFIKYDYKKS